MTKSTKYDAVVVGSGPNGLAAAIVLAQKGLSVILLEARETLGGGTRTAELTLPGFLHDICSAIHPVGAASPFFRALDLHGYGLNWIYPPASLAHPLDDGTAILLERSIEQTADSLGVDASPYRKLMEPLSVESDRIVKDLLGPLKLPRYPKAFIKFGRYAFRSAYGLAESLFKGERGQALFAGLGAHSILPLERPFSASFALMLGSLGHAVGWPVTQGGSQKIADALEGCLRSLGGHIETNVCIRSLDELPQATAVLFNVTPRQFLKIAGTKLTARNRRYLQSHKYGPGVFKVDWALDGPIPWKATECVRAATVHLGGTLAEIAYSERSVWEGRHPDKPFVILAQQSLFDTTRAPAGKHTAWGYCHVPNGSTFNMTDRIEAQVERFAPGFRECILARHVMSPADLEEYNPNYMGGDIAGGAQEFWQLFARPRLRDRNPYATPIRGFYLCSSSTPPGGGVHGMCGYHAAITALRYIF